MYINNASGEDTVGLNFFSAAPTDILMLDVSWSSGATVPGSRNLATEGTLSTCGYCVQFGRNCTTGATGTCSSWYLARAGTMTVSQATRGSPGTFSASVSNLVLYPWNPNTDTALSGGCLSLSSASLTTSW